MSEDAFSRLQLLFGETNLRRLAAASVAVFGVGGVGSFAAEALARGAVGRLTLIDFDRVAASNINRQIHALPENVGQFKVDVLAARCRAINPALRVDAVVARYDAESADELVRGDYDCILDCIDLVTSKLLLIQHCKRLGLPIISSMGAANKTDPTAIRSGDLFTTNKCRLARIMRKELRRRGVDSGVDVVYSVEEFRPLGGGRRDSDDESGYQQRRAPLGSSSYIPPIFGLTMAGLAIERLLSEKVSNQLSIAEDPHQQDTEDR